MSTPGDFEEPVKKLKPTGILLCTFSILVLIFATGIAGVGGQDDEGEPESQDPDYTGCCVCFLLFLLVVALYVRNSKKKKRPLMYPIQRFRGQQPPYDAVPPAQQPRAPQTPYTQPQVRPPAARIRQPAPQRPQRPAYGQTAARPAPQQQPYARTQPRPITPAPPPGRQEFRLPAPEQGMVIKDKISGKDITVLRETENIRGYVRVKAAIENRTDFVITDVELDMKFDGKIFRLARIEPDYDREGTKARIGIISAGEKKTVAFYLDPQICTTATIDAIASYKDHKGKLHTMTMRPKAVNVICPIFFTEENANTAMLKNLVSGVLEHQDSKIYSLPRGLSPSSAFELARSAVSGRSIQFVRDFCQTDPHRSEAWYYGVTKVKQIQMVMKVSVDGEKEAIEIFSATSNGDALTGLLAELSHDLKKKLKEHGMPTTQITNVTIRDSVLNRSSLLFDEAAGEGGNVCLDDSVVKGAAGSSGVPDLSVTGQLEDESSCPACGKYVEPGNNFCINCGAVME